jgi:hypothetical protein
VNIQRDLQRRSIPDMTAIAARNATRTLHAMTQSVAHKMSRMRRTGEKRNFCPVPADPGNENTHIIAGK